MKQLRITTSEPGFFGFSGESLVTEPLVEIIPLVEQKGKSMYIHGEAEAKAGYDIPIVLNGDLNNLNLPIDEQDIVLVLPSGEFKCKATIEKDLIYLQYYITLFNEEL